MQELKNLVWYMFSFLCIWLWEYENCLSELADVTGQLKNNLCHSWECSYLCDSTEARPVLPKVFHHDLFGFDLLAHLSFPLFSNSSSNFRTVSDFLWHLWQVFQFVSILHLCFSLRQPLHCLHHHQPLLSWFVGKKMPSLWLCVPAPVRKCFFCHHPLSLCVKGSRAAARVAKAEVTNCYC